MLLSFPLVGNLFEEKKVSGQARMTREEKDWNYLNKHGNSNSNKITWKEWKE
jgi:hypothetical protein